MDFTLNEDQHLIQQTVREFVQENAELSVQEFMSALAEMDFMGIFVPEEYSGPACDFTSYIAVVEELAKVSASVALTYAIHNTQTIYSILQWGSDELKKNYLPLLAAGKKLGGYAYTEAGDGEELFDIAATAVKKDDSYVLNGTKTFVLNGGIADVYIVFAHMDNQLNAFVVDKETKGVSFETSFRKMGLDGVPAMTMKLDNAVIPVQNRIGAEGAGTEILAGISNLHGISLSAIAVGLSETGLAKCISYGKERVQFKKPIITFDAPREMVGGMIINIEAARLLTYEAAAMKDKDEDFVEKAQIARQFSLLSGEQNCRNAIQVHGGYGYTKDLGVEVLLRDIKGISVLENLARPLILTIADSRIG